MLNTTDLLEPTTDQPRDRRMWLVRVWDEPDGRSVTVGILGVLLVHLLILLLGPRLLRMEGAAPAGVRHQAQPHRFNIHLAPETFHKPAPKPPAPKRFVETNPNAPENTPDNTANFGARNQQAAQEKHQLDAHGDRPQLDGRKNIHNTQVVSGQLARPSPPAAAPTPPSKQKPRREQDPLTGFEKVTGNDPTGFGSGVAPKLDHSSQADELIKGAKDSPFMDGADQDAPAIDPAHPRSRPMLQHLQSRPAIFEDNQFGTRNVGVAANDSRFNSYGAYLERMSEAVQTQWDRIMDHSQNFPHDTWLTIVFTLRADGSVGEVRVTDSTTTEEGREACISALTTVAPFPAWTEDMVAMLGKSQDLTYTFYYQD